MIYEKNRIFLKNKKINNLDKFVIKFVKILEKYTRYVIVSGYVSILFGRSRATEYIDIIVEKKDLSEFFSHLEKKNYWLINASFNEANENIKYNAIRIAKKGKFIPNIELKIAKTDIEKIALSERIRVFLNSSSIYISPIELQIAYKLFLSSEKDIEDARHLFNIFSDKIKIEELKKMVEELKVEKKLKYLGIKYD